ncbi:DUF4276 family protein [Rhodobacteraceae bacterium W635]|uniref:DUF4276 family protein n=1 Tax=Nioella halotolerans TaxID=2303578 RepID=UPI000E3B67A5|nr:DUF4276 family protein [Rhodobacteraceae bacterium W635]
MKLVVFTEEPSMKVTIEEVINKLKADARGVRIISFDGVGNLEKDLPAQLRAVAKDPLAKALILCDNDSGNCVERKSKLTQMVSQAGISDRAKVRIVCQMLEGWFIGDTDALTKSRHFKKPIPKRLTRCNPDVQPDPKAQLKKLRNDYTEIQGAKAIAPYLTPSRNRSKSFNHTVQALRDLLDN